MLNAISLSVPLIIAFAAVFALFCIALMMYEKREDKRARRRKEPVYIRGNGTRSRRLA